MFYPFKYFQCKNTLGFGYPRLLCDTLYQSFYLRYVSVLVFVLFARAVKILGSLTVAA
jgi:hypothetical protein